MPAPLVYFEFAGPDVAALRAFYSGVFGWQIGTDSAIAAANTGSLRGGLRQDPPDKVLYFGVPDITQSLATIAASGGTVVIPRTVVPGVVTFALFKDPAFLAYLAKVRPYLRDQEVRLLTPSACNPPIGDTVFTR